MKHARFAISEEVLGLPWNVEWVCLRDKTCYFNGDLESWGVFVQEKPSFLQELGSVCLNFDGKWQHPHFMPLWNPGQQAKKKENLKINLKSVP